jgi:hypothetical protein
MTLFDEASADIQQAYEEFGHTLGWRFLYTPAETLNPKAPLLFAGLNPGGRAFESPQASSEGGNAYRIEPWGIAGRLNRLQEQVCGLYERIAANSSGWNRDGLMDASLAANYCPFRSADWASLPRKRESVVFSRNLWRRLLASSLPPLIIALTERVAAELQYVLITLGGSQYFHEYRPVGWGSVTYSVRQIRVAERTVLIIGLPHLSRFAIIGRAFSESAVSEMARIAAERL